MFTSYETTHPVATAPGVERRVLAYDKNIMLVEFSFAGGVTLTPHQHPHCQVSYVQSGTVVYTVGDETRTLHAGDSVTIPPNTLHNCLPATAAVLLDVFTPQRDDFL